MNDYSKGFPPPATELDLNNSGETGDREGEEEEKREVKGTSRTDAKKKLTTCLDKEKKKGSFWLPHWCNVWRHALWGWGSLMVTMVPGSRYVCSTHAREEDPQNDREERILAMLGIIGTILNLLVVIFVYIYTTVT
ncbi:GRAM domain containing protein 2A [Dissostichus eleginoides]|uniref:GRAM domain containing protein 2A n=1 Tax=Dissostichus eleginoides TaxID=100907 RepID=A0AAD9CEY0_DISEL|nr:GRAM domain containing protein 2A [Dissostichus eleginoides]